MNKENKVLKEELRFLSRTRGIPLEVFKDISKFRKYRGGAFGMTDENIDKLFNEKPIKLNIDEIL